MTTDIQCPCCSGATLTLCCQEIVTGNTYATTPLALMRSRYTAHVQKNMDHILRTMRGKALKLFDEEKTYSEWFMQTVWNKLEIIDAPDVGKYDNDGIVEFKAYYTFQNEEHVLHERSKFKKEDGKWYYIAGQHKSPIVQASAKVGRNEVCPCGSGKKYKKCCASATS